jgi:GNAT superfamily N-acetyltransferase
MGVVGVRGFRPADRAAVRDISYRTGFMGESAASFWRHKESWADLLDSLRDRERASGDFIDPRWPAHLHIDLLPAARGTGLGAALMERWLQQLQEAGSPGCHLLTLVENTRALKFFEKSGFRNHGNPTLVGGMRGKRGERLHQQITVWNP